MLSAGDDAKWERMSDEEFDSRMKPNNAHDANFIKSVHQETKQPFLVLRYSDLVDYDFDFKFLSDSCVMWKGDKTVLSPQHRSLTLLIVRKHANESTETALTTYTNAGGRRILFVRAETVLDLMVKNPFLEEILGRDWTVVRESGRFAYVFEQYAELCERETAGSVAELLKYVPDMAAARIVEFCHPLQKTMSTSKEIEFINVNPAAHSYGDTVDYVRHSMWIDCNFLGAFMAASKGDVFYANSDDDDNPPDESPQ
jgi:hypothetical protein